MTWNEEDHPRDELGRFTFSDGADENDGSSDGGGGGSFPDTRFRLRAEVNVSEGESITDALYKNSKTKAQQEKAISEYKNLLFDVLGNKATHADKLYGDTRRLEKRIREHGLGKKLRSKIMQSKFLQGVTEKMIGGNYNKHKYNSSWLSGADVQGTLDIAHGEENMHNPDYLKDTVRLKNYDDPAINSYKDTIKAKVLKEFKDYGYSENTIGNIKGYYFKNDSEPSQRISKSNDFRKIIRDNKQNILSNKEFSISFSKHGPFGLLSDNNLHNAIGKAQLLDYYINKQGNLHVKILDTYDFNKDAKDFLNKAGRSQMLKGNLKPYFSVYEVSLTKEELNEIWNN